MRIRGTHKTSSSPEGCAEQRPQIVGRDIRLHAASDRSADDECVCIRDPCCAPAPLQRQTLAADQACRSAQVSLLGGQANSGCQLTTQATHWAKPRGRAATRPRAHHGVAWCSQVYRRCRNRSWTNQTLSTSVQDLTRIAEEPQAAPSQRDTKPLYERAPAPRQRRCESGMRRRRRRSRRQALRV